MLADASLVLELMQLRLEAVVDRGKRPIPEACSTPLVAACARARIGRFHCSSRQILFALARAFVVGLAAGGGAGVVALPRRIFDGLTGGVLVAVARVLDQLAFGFFEALGFATAALHDRTRGFVRRFLGGRLGADTSADRRGLGRGRLGLFSGWIRSRHAGFLTRPLSRQTIVVGNGTPSICQRRSVGSRTVQSHFRLEVRNQGRATVIAVSGELELASSPALQEELDRVAVSDSQMLIIDLRELDFMDSTGLSVLVRAHQRIEEQGRQLAMVKGPQQVQRLLSLTGVAERLTLVDTPEELLGQD